MALVQCAQTGKQYSAHVKHLSREDGDHLTDDDFKEESVLMWDYKGKDYPVTFFDWKGMDAPVSLCNDLCISDNIKSKKKSKTAKNEKDNTTSSPSGKVTLCCVCYYV